MTEDNNNDNQQQPVSHTIQAFAEWQIMSPERREELIRHCENHANQYSRERECPACNVERILAHAAVQGFHRHYPDLLHMCFGLLCIESPYAGDGVTTVTVFDEPVMTMRGGKELNVIEPGAWVEMLAAIRELLDKHVGTDGGVLMDLSFMTHQRLRIEG